MSTHTLLGVLVVASSAAAAACVWLGLERDNVVLIVAGLFAALAAFYAAVVFVETRRRPRR